METKAGYRGGCLRCRDPLPDAGMALYALHAKAGVKALLVFGEIGDELRHRGAEFTLLLRT